MSTYLEFPVYTVYQTTCLIDGRIYIGVHKTRIPEDRYLGSGKLLCRAVRAHGRDSFRKEVLFVFDTPCEAYRKEAELVNASFVRRADTFNLTVGGAVNRNGREGEANSQHGTCWVWRGGEAPKKVQKGDYESEANKGWLRGRGPIFKSALRKSPQMGPRVSGKVAVHLDGGTRYILMSDLKLFESEGWVRGRASFKYSPEGLKAQKESRVFGESCRHSKLRAVDIDQIKLQYREGVSQGSLAKRYGVSQPMISKIVRGHSWVRSSVGENTSLINWQSEVQVLPNPPSL